MKPDRNSELIENYKEALFALAMNDIMIEEGEYWEEVNERLKSDPGFKLPETLTHRCMRAIERGVSQKEHRLLRSSIWKITTRIAVAFLAVFIAFSFTFMTVSAVQVPVLDFFISNFGNGAFVRAEQTVEDTGMVFGPKWVPAEDWEVDMIANEENIRIIHYNYKDGKYIKYREQLYVEEVSIIDTEDVVFSEQIINDHDVLIGKKNDMTSLYWKDTREGIEWYCEMRLYGFEDDVIFKILNSCI